MSRATRRAAIARAARQPVRRRDVGGFIVAAALTVGAFALAPLAHATEQREETVPPPHPTVGSVLPGCAAAIAADDDAANCDGGDHLIYRERLWLNADAPILTANHVLLLGDTAYLECVDPDAEDAGPCFVPGGEHGRTETTIVSGDDEERLSDLTDEAVVDLTAE